MKKSLLILTLCLAVSFGSVLKRQAEEETTTPTPVKLNDESTSSAPVILNEESTSGSVKLNDESTTSAPAKLNDESTAPAIPVPTKCPPKPDALEELDLERVMEL